MCSYWQIFITFKSFIYFFVLVVGIKNTYIFYDLYMFFYYNYFKSKVEYVFMLCFLFRFHYNSTPLCRWLYRLSGLDLPVSLSYGVGYIYYTIVASIFYMPFVNNKATINTADKARGLIVSANLFFFIHHSEFCLYVYTNWDWTLTYYYY